MRQRRKRKKKRCIAIERNDCTHTCRYMYSNVQYCKRRQPFSPLTWYPDSLGVKIFGMLGHIGMFLNPKISIFLMRLFDSLQKPDPTTCTGIEEISSHNPNQFKSS